MCEVFLVHPDLNITDCKDFCSLDLKKYQVKYARAVKEYERLIDNVILFNSDADHGKSTTVQSLTQELSKSSLKDSQDDSDFFICGDGINAGVPSVPDVDVELSKLSSPITGLEVTLLGYYRTRLEVAYLELHYAKSYCLMNETMRDLFSKLELSFQDEEDGIKLISQQTASIKALEQKLLTLKNREQELENTLVKDFGVLGHQDQYALSGSRRKSSGTSLESINEEEPVV